MKGENEANMPVHTVLVRHMVDSFLVHHFEILSILGVVSILAGSSVLYSQRSSWRSTTLDVRVTSSNHHHDVMNAVSRSNDT